MKNYCNYIKEIDPNDYKQSNRRAFVTKDDKNYIMADYSLAGRSTRIIVYCNKTFGDFMYEYNKKTSTITISVFQSDIRTSFKLDHIDSNMFATEQKRHYSSNFYLLIETLMLATLTYQINKIFKNEK